VARARRRSRRYHHGHVADFVHQARETGRIHALDAGTHRKPAVHVEDLARVLVAAATSDRGPAGILNVVGGAWGWRETVRLMGVPATCDEMRATGWIGDSTTATFDARRLAEWYPDVAPSRAIHHGVADALASLGWPQ
jgi:nucleoside-diphosphate-sugar epimerase